MATSVLLGCVLLIFTVTRLYDRARRAQRDLPSRGFPGIWSSYGNSVINCFRADAAIKSECLKHGGRLFTFSQMGHWVVLAKTKEHITDIYNAPEEVLSMENAADELLQLHRTVGPQFCQETYHIHAIRTSLTQNLALFLPDLVDELVLACHDTIDSVVAADDQGWSSVRAMDAISYVVCRASNRVFVGAPLCRDAEYCRLASGFTSEVLSSGPIIKFLVPEALRPLAGAVYKMIYGHHRRMLKHIRPLVESRRRQRAYSPEKEPNDMLKWLMDTAPSAEEHSAESLAMRILNVNYVALHTTTKTFVHALYTLAAQPAYIPTLRAEAESTLGCGDPRTWTKESLARCVKMDSFFKETLRLHGLGAIWMPRRTVADFTFSDGTKIPKGYFVATAATAVHEDPKVYERPDEFKGLRFAAARGQGPLSDWDESASKSDGDWIHRLTGTSTSYLAFGGGRHVCPGRFFAATEMKCLMAYLVLNYDMRVQQDGVRPADEWFGPTLSPARNANVLFRRRMQPEALG